MRTFLLCLPWLAASLATQAQTQTGVATGISTTTEPVSPYQVQRDSLWRRAGRIRYETAARTQAIRTGFVGLLGTQHNVLSLGQPPRPVMDDSRTVPIKREIEKHKTRNARVRKVTYYTAGGKPRLYEYYEDGQLVQLELYDYPLSTGSGANTFVTMRWVRGNYLSVSERASTGTGGSRTQYQAYAEPEPLPR